MFDDRGLCLWFRVVGACVFGVLWTLIIVGLGACDF